MFPKDLAQFLTKYRLSFVLHQHPATFTCAEAKKLKIKLPGVHSKNLFLKVKKQPRYFLVIMPQDERLDLRKFKNQVGLNNLVFASAENLKAVLKLTPGSVTPFGLIHDKKKLVTVYLHPVIYHANILNFHPNINTASLEITQATLRHFFSILQYEINLLA